MPPSSEVSKAFLSYSLESQMDPQEGPCLQPASICEGVHSGCVGVWKCICDVCDKSGEDFSS